MIELIPAIDILEGRCVRLAKGNYDKKTEYEHTLVEVAQTFEKYGFRRLHVVDLDGAKARHIVNGEALKAIAKSTNLTIDFGGGIKTDEDIQKAFDCGATMVTIGSVAVTHPEIVYEWIDRYGAERIIIGADVKDGVIAINGWLEKSQEGLFPFIQKYIKKGINKILCTDISRDGMMKGPAVDLYMRILQEFPHLHLIASGGVSSNEDICQLEAAGVPAVVFGKVYYEGKINVEQLLENRE